METGANGVKSQLWPPAWWIVCILLLLIVGFIWMQGASRGCGKVIAESVSPGGNLHCVVSHYGRKPAGYYVFSLHHDDNGAAGNALAGTQWVVSGDSIKFDPVTFDWRDGGIIVTAANQQGTASATFAEGRQSWVRVAPPGQFPAEP